MVGPGLAKAVLMQHLLVGTVLLRLWACQATVVRLVGWLACWLVGCLVRWMAGWLVGWLVGGLVGWLIGWLVGRLVSCSLVGW